MGEFVNTDNTPSNHRLDRSEKWWEFVAALIKAGFSARDAQALADHPETWAS